MLFEQMTPDTVKYMIAGYVVIFGVMAIYLVSLFLRWRNLRRNLQTLEEMQEKR
jgi:hypothetical protein